MIAPEALALCRITRDGVGQGRAALEGTRRTVQQCVAATDERQIPDKLRLRCATLGSGEHRRKT
jgi:hypothetical protein